MRPEIGDQVYTFVNEKRMDGVLVCASGMGLTPIDLFNDILVMEQDLRTFLWQNNVENCSSNLPGMIIQSYLTFCEKARAEIWSTTKPVPVTTFDELKENDSVKDEDVMYQHSEETMIDTVESTDSDKDQEPTIVKRKRKKTPGRARKAAKGIIGRPPSEKKKDKLVSDVQKREVDLLELVPTACDICRPDTWLHGTMEFYKIGNQTDLGKS